MAGHSKWANIKHQKSRNDAKRGKLFTKHIREITTAARLGGGDINSNPRLRLAVDKAFKEANMKRDTINKAIERGTGGGDDSDYQPMSYEGYGPGGVAILVDCLSDNKNRTVAEVRHAFSKCGGNLGTDGSVSYLFSKQGQITFAPGCDEEKLMNVAIEAGAEDIQHQEDGSLDVITQAGDFLAVKEAIEASEMQPDFADIVMEPSTKVELDEETAEKLLRLVDMLEDLDDVQTVSTNADIADDIIEKLQ